MKKFRKFVAVIPAMLAVASLVSCGGGETPVETKNEFTVCIASNPDTIDPALNSAVDGATLIVHAFSGLLKLEKNSAGDVEIVPDVASEMPTYKTNADGSCTVTVKLKSGLKWSDGTSYDANAFVYSWNRAASGKTASDYGYMFDGIKNYAACSADTTGAEKLGVSASSDGMTLTIELDNYLPYFDGLLAFPTFFPVNQKAVEANPDTWATSPSTYISNGPMKLSSWTLNSNMVYEKNPNYFDADKVTCDKLTFALSDDDASILTNYQNGSYDFIDTVPNDQIKTLQASSPKEFFIDGIAGTYYISYNVSSPVFDAVADTETKRESLRNGLNLLIDRNYICDEIGQAGQTPGNGFVCSAISDTDGSKWVSHNGPKHDGSGYYSVAAADLASNRAKGVEMIKAAGFTYDETSKKFTNVPSFEYILNNSSGHIAIAEYLQSTFKQYGIEMKLVTSEWADFLNTRKAGGYTLARNGWNADFDDAINFLDMWTSGSGNNDSQYGKGSNAKVKHYSADLNRDGSIGSGESNLTWSESYDALVTLSRKETDKTKRSAILHELEDLLMSTGGICPIYNYTDVYMKKESMDGFYDNAFGYKYFMYCKKA
jgi:oligopeptide transport system substrate-binding protein